MSRDRTRAEIAEAFGVKPRTVTTWVAQGCPASYRGRRPFFDEDEVRAWRASRGGPVEPAAPPAESQGSRFTSRASLARAELARKLTVARKNELELDAERGLKDLDLGTKVRAAKTHDDMLAISAEVCALVGTGALSPSRGRAIQGLLAEMRHSLKEHRGTEIDEDPERFVPLSEEGVELVEDFEAIVSDERRTEILEHVRSQRAVDAEEHPSVDLAGEIPEETDAAQPEEDA